VLANDTLNNATPTVATVNLTQISTSTPKVTLNPATGAVIVAPGTPGGSYQVVYQICEKANPTNCSQATVTVPVTIANATITIKKALAGGGRINAADQFTVQLLQQWDKVAVGTGTTKGSGSTVDPGTGTTNPVLVDSPDDGAYYKMSEAMANGSVSALLAYTTTVSCQNYGVGGTDVSYVHSLNDTLSAYWGDTIVCTITNSSPGVATLAVRQKVVSPVPVNLLPPYTFSYTGGNGWSSPPLTNTAQNTFAISNPVKLSATNTATTVSVTLPEPRYFVAGFSCADTSAPGSGNQTGNLVSVKTTSVTIPAANVRPNATLLCTLLLGHFTP
jgi:hypothetical protein